MLMLVLLALLAPLASSSSSSSSSSCRDVYKQPFNTQSIWNTPIGSNATYVYANIYNGFPPAVGCEMRRNTPHGRTPCPASTEEQCVAIKCCWLASPSPSADASASGTCFQPAGLPPVQFHNDQEFYVEVQSGDPIVDWHSQNDWSRLGCDVYNKTVAARIQFPVNWTTSGQPNNNGAGVLMSDRRTLIEMQPLYRCQTGGPITAGYHTGCPVPFPPWHEDIFNGTGNWGAHGGSGLSAVGGSIRSMELSTTTGPIMHALKLELLAHDYYWAHERQPSAPGSFRWPAHGSDSYTFDKSSDLFYNGTVPGMLPGALLAVPPKVAANLPMQTVPGKKILDALTHFGGYLVDDTAMEAAAICCQREVNDELLQEYGISFAYPTGVQPGHPFYEDLLTVFRHLYVVQSNDAEHVGGGGEPIITPPAPPCP